MKKLKFISAHCENFKGFKRFDIQFGEKLTTISGINGIGKSTIASLIMWVLFGVDYDLTNNPKVRREVGGIPVNDVSVLGELTMLIDDTEVVARKVQKRAVKDDGSYADANTYSINEVEKTLRDFQAYFSFSFDDLLMCMNIGSFLSKKTTEMREFLFKLPEDISDKDIIGKFPEFATLVPLTEKYTIEEISAMNKASIAKLNKEIAGYPGRIDEVNRQIIEDVDTAELELQVSALKKQISEVEKQEEDSFAQARELETMSKDIMDLQFKKSDIERNANTSLIEHRKEIQKRIDDFEMQFRQTVNDVSMAEMEKQRLTKSITRKKEEKAKLLEEWKKLNAAEYPEYKPIPQLSETDLICPTCGQALPEDVKAEKLAAYDENSQKHRASYNHDKTLWENERQKKMEDISVKGKALQAEVAELENVKFPEAEKIIKALSDKRLSLAANQKKAIEELNVLPTQVDLSENQEYEALCLEISKKEEAMRSVNTGADYRATLKNKKAELQSELDSVKEKIAKVFLNVELEERISFLRSEQAQKEQAKADCERIINLLEQLDQKKNDLLTDEINGHFGKVKWKLFSFAKNGNYKKDYCVPVIDGYSLNDNTANKGRVIEAKVDIAISVQKIVGLNCPIILDDAESLDENNLKRILGDLDCQCIVLSVSSDTKLKVEVG